MEPNTVESNPSAALSFMVDPLAALQAAERLGARCVARRRHSIILGRLINDDEARRLDRQREDDQRREAQGLAFDEDDYPVTAFGAH